MNVQPADQIALTDDAEVGHQLVVTTLLGDELFLPYAHGSYWPRRYSAHDSATTSLTFAESRHHLASFRVTPQDRRRNLESVIATARM